MGAESAAVAFRQAADVNVTAISSPPSWSTDCMRAVWSVPSSVSGNKRAGDLRALQELGRGHGFSAGEIGAVQMQGQRVSSSLIREQLAEGDLQGAAMGLGRRYSIAGKVVRGRQLGRQLGYPTANIRLMGKLPALGGIYATWVHGAGPEPRASVSSLGTRPTVFGTEPLLEAHLFDFDEDLYGQRLAIEFVASCAKKKNSTTCRSSCGRWT